MSLSTLQSVQACLCINRRVIFQNAIHFQKYPKIMQWIFIVLLSYSNINEITALIFELGKDKSDTVMLTLRLSRC